LGEFGEGLRGFTEIARGDIQEAILAILENQPQKPDTIQGGAGIF